MKSVGAFACLLGISLCLASLFCSEERPVERKSNRPPDILPSSRPLVFEGVQPETLYVTARDGLNLRANPNIHAEVKAKLPYGFALVCQSQSTQAVDLNGRRGRWCEIRLEVSGRDQSFVEYHGYVFASYLSNNPVALERSEAETDPFAFFTGRWHQMNGHLISQEIVVTAYMENVLLAMNANFVLESFLVKDLAPECAGSLCALKRNGEDYIQARILGPRVIQLYDGPKYATSGNHHAADESILDGTYLYNPAIIDMR